jgi:hypothetical protein
VFFKSIRVLSNPSYIVSAVDGVRLRECEIFEVENRFLIIIPDLLRFHSVSKEYLTIIRIIDEFLYRQNGKN